MANISSAKKATRQTLRRTEINKSFVRKVEDTLEAGDAAAAKLAVRDPLRARANRRSERLMNEFENGLVTTYLAFQRWTDKCMRSVGELSLTFTDIIVLHVVAQCSRGTRLHDISFMLNIEDRHVVAYSLCKLENQGLITGTKQGKEKFYHATQRGEEIRAAYQEVRSSLLISSMSRLQGSETELKTCAEFLRIISGIYEQAARRATLSESDSLTDR